MTLDMDDKLAVMQITHRPAQVFVRGKGSWLWDEEGKAYLDFIQGWAVNSLGHSPQQISAALAEQSGRLLNPSPGFYNRPMLELARLLVSHSCFDEVFFANSGAEANEGAIKLARKWGQLHKQGAYRIISFDNGFHGRTLATMSASGKSQWEGLYEPRVPGFVKLPYNDIAALEAAIDDSIVAVMLEPVQGEAGVIPAQLEFLRELRRLCDAYGLLLIFDEVQTGIGRCGQLFAYQHYGVEPDVMTLGKGLGGGVPLAALLTRQRFSCFAYGDQGGTFNGNPLMTAVGVAVLGEVLSDGFLQRVRQRGALLRQRLEGLSHSYGMGEVRGQGLLLAMDTAGRSAPAIVSAALQRGLILNAPREHILRFMPALTVSEAEIEQMITILAGLLSQQSAN